jgi:hypothetical protein
MTKMIKSVAAAVMLASASAAGTTCTCTGLDYNWAETINGVNDLATSLGLPASDFCESCDLMCFGTGVATCADGCFPATATVTLADNSAKQMGALTTGDKVHVGNGQYDDVFFFSTQLESTMSKFVVLSTSATETPLKLTSGHYLYVNGKLATASSVKKGDMLTLANGNKAAVSEVSSEWAPGLYNPHTLNGDIVVDGVLTSTYTNAVDPTLAHALLLPLRQMYAMGSTFGQGFSAMAKGVPSWIRQAVL